jgi:signal peptidase I
VKRITRLRAGLFTAAFVAAVAVAWLYLAPTNVGGSTSYVVTSGISMQPRFHSGDLAVLRPASDYKVGEIVAYHSPLLRVTVLHRIVARDGNRYVFKGDNNNFLDPVRVSRSEVLGRLWVRVPHAGRLLAALHDPIVAAIICTALGIFLFFGVKEPGRRRKRRRKDTPKPLFQATPLMNTSPAQSLWRRIDVGACLIASAVAAAAFLMLVLIAFTRPASKLSQKTKPYTQQVTFGYSAHAHAGPVYPTGAVHTGDPIFLSLVRQIGVQVNYRFMSEAPHNVVGTEEILLHLTSPTGWKRDVVLTPQTHFTGDHTSATVTLDMPQIGSLVQRVGALTGMPASGYTIAIEPRVHITGTVGGHPLNLSFNPRTDFQLAGQQLIPQGSSGGSSPAGASTTSLSSSRAGAVGTPVAVPATITALGASVKVSPLRWLSLLGLLLSIGATAYFYLRKRSEPFVESARIQSQYGHMIVPIVGGEDLGWPPVDVPNMKALVKLAESGQRMILHNRANNVDTYMLNEEGTVYRYQVKPSNVVWGEWSETSTEEVTAAA